MTIPFTNRATSCPSRRQFLATTAAGLTCWSCASPTYSKVTGSAVSKLVAYDDLMIGFMREHKPPGAALAVTYHGRLVYARGFGFADLEKQEPVHHAALFRIASVSKPFTSAAVMRLVQQGKLKLDDRVFRFSSSSRAWSKERVSTRAYTTFVSIIACNTRPDGTAASRLIR